jgi:hypothetical protein
VDLISSTFKMTIGVLGWMVSVPGKLWSLRQWSRDDWSGWWGGIKKTVKEEAHHYWVSRGRNAAGYEWESGWATRLLASREGCSHDRVVGSGQEDGEGGGTPLLGEQGRVI